jgi:biogenesis of lysosome-related organelles complex 1 subunit KXD1
MSTAQGYYYPPSYQYQYPTYPSASQPINMPQKPGYYPPYPHQQPYPYGRVSVSPPENSDSGTTSGVPSYEPSGTASSYAASASEYESSAGSAGSVDLLDYMNDRLNGAFDPIPLDRSLATQAKT